MSKIEELNKAFKEKTFFTSSESYNNLLGHSQGLARLVDSRDCMLRTWEEKSSGLESKIRNLETQIQGLKNKYVRSVLRDPKTGRYLKRKK